MLNNPQVWHQIGVYFVFYAVFLVLIVVGYPLAQMYAKPVASLIFPINPDTSLLRVVMVMTLMYWGVAGVMIAANYKKPPNP